MFNKINRIVLPEFLSKMNEVFAQAGFEAYLVGGAVRDYMMGRKPHDYDVATNAKPEEVIQLFKFVVPTGIAHGTVTVHFMKNEIEVTTFRTESDYSDGRHPDKVEYAGHIEEDLSRRDFTMNAIAISLADGRIVDPFGGKKDIQHKLIRCVGKPEERFMEDGLRPIRAIRFSSQLDFGIEKATYEEIFKPEILNKISSISVERFRDELMKMLKSEKPSLALKRMEDSGIMKLFMPQLLEGRNCIQKDDRAYHVFDVLDHNLYACDGAPKDKPLVRLAALFHDIGKPRVKEEVHENGITMFHFYNHEKASSKMARELMVFLKFSNAEIEHVCHLIENHMFNYESTWSDAAVRRFIVKTGIEYIPDLIDLRLADMYGKYNQNVRIHDSASCSLLIELQDRINKLVAEKDALSLKNLAVNGRDLMAAGIPAGKSIGQILNELFDCVLEDPAMNTKEKLMEIALNIYKEMK